MTDDPTLARYAEFNLLAFDRPAPHVLRVTLNRPDARNALDPELEKQVHHVWAAVDADPETRVAIVTGAGKAFSAGGSLDDMQTGEADSNDKTVDIFGNGREMVRTIIDMKKPLVSAINGAAVGAGLALALLADVPIAAKEAKIFDGHLRIGVGAGDHAALIWPLLCGIAKAKYFVMTNRIMTGEEAERHNLVALAVPREELADTSVQIASELANVAPTALRMTKYAMNHWLRQAQPIFDLSLALEAANFGSAENKEAIRAMMAGETPKFEGGDEFF